MARWVRGVQWGKLFSRGFTAGTVNGMAFECPNEAQSTEFCGALIGDFGGIARVLAGFQGFEKVKL
jgi:hypothetical protein